MAVSIVRDAAFRLHLPGPRHPESPGRLGAIDEALATSSLEMIEVPARPALSEELLRAHEASHLSALDETRGRSVVLDPDTRTSPGSYDAALLAAGGAIDIALGVAKGQVPPGIALVRPPGHHATADRAMGFCLINNVAVAARALIAAGLAERVAIVDFDVHHGNGTEAIFYADPAVLFLSTHQWPLYPGTGEAHRTGIGAGLGFTVNVPLPAGAGDAEILAAMEDRFAPKLRAFRPDFILMSAGFDAFVDDPLGGLVVTVEGFREIAKRHAALADELCGGRIAATLEGGYDLPGLGRSVTAFLEAWDR